jgi:hypothetical protein
VKTRVGFAKSDLSGEGARSAGRPRDELGARTVIGHAPAEVEPYRPGEPRPGDAVPEGSPAGGPGQAGEESPAVEPTPPAHTGKSGFPANAGFWGRRDDDGELVPLTDPGPLADGWRGFFTPLRRAQLRRAARSLFIIAAAAALGFTGVYLVLELRNGGKRGPQAAAPRPVPAAIPATAPPAPAPPVPAAAPPPPRAKRPPQAGRTTAPPRAPKRTPPRSSDRTSDRTSDRDPDVLRPTL